MSNAVLVTGATGFVGRHFVVALLENCPTAVVICLARAYGHMTAADRVLASLEKACDDNCCPQAFERIRERVVTIEADIVSPASTWHPQVLERVKYLEPSQVWHCAASVAFADGPTNDVWKTNTLGLMNILQLAQAVGTTKFNHVSTAYVAGSMIGTIPERFHEGQEGFNNIYERSKYEAEAITRQYAQQCGMRYRILRPSIVIGHSRTFKSSSPNGFYQVVNAVDRCLRGISCKYPNHFMKHPLSFTFDRDANLDCIPIDILAKYLVNLYSEVDDAKCIYHLTSGAPVSTYDLLSCALGIMGIRQLELVRDQNAMNSIDKIVYRAFGTFRPYMNSFKMFDNSNILDVVKQVSGRRYLLDLSRFRDFTHAYLASRDSTQSQVYAV